MTIPAKIKKEHIRGACKAVLAGKVKIPANRQSVNHCLAASNRHFPPKFIVSLAGKLATGATLPAGGFNGGPETNDFLDKLGFEVVACHCGGVAPTNSLKSVKVLKSEYIEEHKVARIICLGPPPRSVKKARKALNDAFSDSWPRDTRAKVTITPGGFVAVPFPKDWAGRSGWQSKAVDIGPLYSCAEVIVREILDESMLSLAAKRTDILTLGFDFIARKGGGGSHAELVAIINLKTRVISWTGKSYPVVGQEKTLVHVTSVKSHFLEIGGERILVLGCHDLNAFSNRSRPKDNSPRLKRQRTMREKSRMFRPTMVLHHPHSTDTDRIWQVAWCGVREHVWNHEVGYNTCASGIAWFLPDAKPRGKLVRVLETTRRGDVIDIVLH